MYVYKCVCVWLPDKEIAAITMEYLQHITAVENIHVQREDVLLGCVLLVHNIIIIGIIVLAVTMMGQPTWPWEPPSPRNTSFLPSSWLHHYITC